MDGEVTTNKVYLRGIVNKEPIFSHEVYGERFFTFILAAQRMSGTEDRIVCTISERLMLGVMLGIGDMVEIDGQYRSYNSIENGKGRLVLTVFVRNIENIEDIPHENIVELEGNICKEVGYRTTPLGREIADILLAVNRSYSKSDYIPCIAWGRNARFCATLAVGSRLRIAGRIQSREYIKQTEEGEEQRTTYEVSVSRLEVLDGQ